ncbi:hypothetical protein D9601_07930 [Sphingomonas sp. MA1305]|nr:hypothetical protein [Sphingomonas sp. MA1305]
MACDAASRTESMGPGFRRDDEGGRRAAGLHPSPTLTHPAPPAAPPRPARSARRSARPSRPR